MYIQDGLLLEEVYCKIPHTSKTKHGLPEYVSLTCESKVKGFLHHLTNFGNAGMRMEIIDDINLKGTA